MALHAIVGFGDDAGAAVIDNLIAALLAEDDARAPAASEALRCIGSDLVLARLIAAKRGRNHPDPWLLATLGRLPPDRVRLALPEYPILDRSWLRCCCCRTARTGSRTMPSTSI